MAQIFIWGIVQACVLYFPAVLLTAVWHFSLRGYAYAAWLSTFDEDWTDKYRYALWCKLISFELWLSSYGDSAESIWGKVESQLISFENWIKLRISNLVSTWKQERIELELMEQEMKKKMMEDTEFYDGVISKLLK
jgi:ABC-type long-subunit fatty acid transport system fused permease/ATPase subunit